MPDVTVGTLSAIAYILNFSTWVIGAALAGSGAYMFSITTDMGAAVNDELAPIMIVLIAIGGVLIFTSTLGVCGVCQKKSLLLSGYIAAMIIILLAQFAAVVIIFTFQSSANYYLHDGMTHTMLFYGKEGDNAKFTHAMDFVQETLHCCGQYGYMDYTTKNASNWYSTEHGALPDTCCEVHTTGCGAGKMTEALSNEEVTGIWPDGCYDLTLDYLEIWLTIIGGAALFFMFVQLFSIFMNICLHRRFKEHEDYQLQSRKVKQVKATDDANDKARSAAGIEA